MAQSGSDRGKGCTVKDDVQPQSER